KLITPLYGGGAETQKPDEVTVVRASEIRGLLRFWWRATRGGQFNGSLDEMRAAEEAIWGSAAGDGKAGPSPVSLAVRNWQRGYEDVPFEVIEKKGRPQIQPRSGSRVPPYAAFSLQPKREEARPGMGLPEVYWNISFEVVITFPKEIRQEVESALWAWETFGGVGARTRRGFGALELVACEENAKPRDIDKPFSKDARQWLLEKLQEQVIDGVWPDNVPHIKHRPLFTLTRREKDPATVWKYLIEKLQTFRQKRHKKYGLSLWPEANVIRKVHKLSLKWPPNVINPRLAGKFPRAHLGLPLIFHMPHDKRLKEDFTLRGQSAPGSDKPIDRLASPLILRPLPCRDGYVGLALVLETPREPPHGLEVDGFPFNQKNVEAQLTAEEARREPLQRILNGEPDVLKAFLKTLGWKEE
ncbi:type III-B CRISPR module RAMP protein Cmr1, partial [Candidatus Parcubacteria bacterium]